MPPTVFSPEELQRVISETLPETLPAGHTNAVVGMVDATGARVAAGFSFDNDRWRFVGAWKHEWAGGDTVGAKVILSW